MSAAALKERLRADLKTAMQAKASAEVAVLRTLIAALDNAEAVPSQQDRYVPRAFGDAGAETARLELDTTAVDRVLRAEIDSRLAAAADYERHQRLDDGARLRGEAELIARYLST